MVSFSSAGHWSNSQVFGNGMSQLHRLLKGHCIISMINACLGLQRLVVKVVRSLVLHDRLSATMFVVDALAAENHCCACHML